MPTALWRAASPARAIRPRRRQHPGPPAGAHGHAAANLTAPGRAERAFRPAAGAGSAALTAYRAFPPEWRLDLDGWTTLVLARRAPAGATLPSGVRRPRLLPMFAARFQTFDDRGDRSVLRGRASRRCAPRWRGAGSTASSSRTRTSTRTNTCRRQRPAGLGHRLHRLGRGGGAAEGQGGDVRRRPLHPAGARPGRRRPVRGPRPGRGRRAGLPAERGQAPAGPSATTRACTAPTRWSG